MVVAMGVVCGAVEQLEGVACAHETTEKGEERKEKRERPKRRDEHSRLEGNGQRKTKRKKK